jgi:hypothetical protein
MTKDGERRLECLQKENLSQNIWFNMREKAVAEEIQQRIRRSLQLTKRG